MSATALPGTSAPHPPHASAANTPQDSLAETNRHIGRSARGTGQPGQKRLFCFHCCHYLPESTRDCPTCGRPGG
jgi:hypothetical protein